MADLTVRFGEVGRLQTWVGRRRGIALGRWGEWIAFCYLEDMGFDILVRSWTVLQGELDFVAYDGEVLVFFEVKTRKTPALRPPEASVTEAKRRQLERLALRFVSRFELDGVPIRFDLIAIDTPDRRHFTLRHYRGFLEE